LALLLVSICSGTIHCADIREVDPPEKGHKKLVSFIRPLIQRLHLRSHPEPNLVEHQEDSNQTHHTFHPQWEQPEAARALIPQSALPKRTPEVRASQIVA
jgi:hypothetical protein